MFGLYDIYREGKKIGKAEVSREGLYYRFRCCCDLEEGEICRITVTCGAKTESLGIPIPNGDSFWLSARLPVSRFGAEEPTFQIPSKERKAPPQLWEPISPENPFPYLEKLDNAAMEQREEVMGILISEEETPDNDPTP